MPKANATLTDDYCVMLYRKRYIKHFTKILMYNYNEINYKLTGHRYSFLIIEEIKSAFSQGRVIFGTDLGKWYLHI